MVKICIQLFGKFCVRRDEQILDGFDARKVQELFCYLLLHRDHSLPREILASILWPDTTTAQSKKNLRQALWQLQSALGSQNQRLNDRIVLVEPDWVQLNSAANFWLDVAVFERTFNLVQKTPGQELDSSTAQLLQETVQLYQGPLLEGWYQDWCLLERERLQSLYLAMLDKLMSYCEVIHDYETGLLYGMRIMCYDRARERTHRRMMRLYYLLGDRAEALRQYERCAAALEEELGISPSKSTIAIYRQIQADQLDEPAPAPVEVDTSPEIPVPPLLEVLGHLAQMQRSLAQLQNEVQQSIQMVEMTLHEKH
ncbi:MAG TPA: BTAD domain-containing putative transcriptional regulator [Ktedonobacteraceae bacterium]|nr:BTAD domain-containing putative transcriptional regulator [Ktedonobacteraceae bacterium]